MFAGSHRTCVVTKDATSRSAVSPISGQRGSVLQLARPRGHLGVLATAVTILEVIRGLNRWRSLRLPRILAIGLGVEAHASVHPLMGDWRQIVWVLISEMADSESRLVALNLRDGERRCLARASAAVPMIAAFDPAPYEG